MSGRTSLAGWGLIASLAVLSLILDHFRMLTSHFNWFMAVQVTAVVAVVAVVIRLARAHAPAGGNAEHPKEEPAETGGDI